MTSDELSTLPADTDPLAALLDGSFADPDTGRPVEIATRALVIADTLAGMEAELVQSLDIGHRIALLSDVTTHAVLGSRVEAALAGRFDIKSIVLPADPSPDQALADRLQAAAADIDGFIAVGAGTINDLTKYVSARAHKPYAVFGTAPSMNGYVSLTASISVHGHKMTLPAQAPRGAFFDLGVLAAAPVRMIRAGLGDSLCRTTAQADWLMAHLLLGKPYRALPFTLLARDEPDLFDQADALVRGDRVAIRTLIRTLVLSGFGTAVIGSSAPASQGEHLVSHYIDMMAAPTRLPVFHGEQVGVTTLSLARLQHRLLENQPTLRAETVDSAAITAHFGPDLAPSIVEEFEAKRLRAPQVDDLNAMLDEKWDAIREALSQVLLPVTRLESVLAAAGAPCLPDQIGLSRSFYVAALQHAREIRNRFTALDLAAASGQLTALSQTI